MAAIIASILGEESLAHLREVGVKAQDVIRLAPLARRLKAEREQMDESIKEIARLLKVPQYKLRACENATILRIDWSVLPRYAAHLGLKAFWQKWAQANQEFTIRHNLPLSL